MLLLWRLSNMKRCHWRGTPYSQRGKNPVAAASNVQSSFSLNQNDVFPLCSYVVKDTTVIKKARNNFHCFEPTKPQTAEIIYVPDSDVKYTDLLLHLKHIQMRFDVWCHKQYGSQLLRRQLPVEGLGFFFFFFYGLLSVDAERDIQMLSNSCLKKKIYSLNAKNLPLNIPQ